jgi:hypothetical protein
MRRLILLQFVVGCTVYAAASAQPSRELSRIAQTAWSSFECVSLSVTMGDDREADRLFKFGMAQFTLFMDAYLAGQVDHSDLARYAPNMSVALSEIGRLERGKPDRKVWFGFIFESAVNAAVKDIPLTDGAEGHKERAQKLAREKYTSDRCSLVGL